ncbi:hypothetical protein G6F37_004800 [Rhizopus arrhizus]|nr:hypothetical protein G6F38_006161 [Rhizopus arrhizus]KAG1159540.1 hypothetical protein G6F37_004800 [Rhizopus arrhizus]
MKSISNDEYLKQQSLHNSMKEVEEGLHHLNIETTIEVDEDFSQAEEEKPSMEEGDVGPQPFTTTVPTIAILTTV